MTTRTKGGIVKTTTTREKLREAQRQRLEWDLRHGIKHKAKTFGSSAEIMRAQAMALDHLSDVNDSLGAKLDELLKILKSTQPQDRAIPSLQKDIERLLLENRILRKELGLRAS